MTSTRRSLITNWTLVGIAFALIITVVFTSDAITSSESESRKRHLLVRFSAEDVAGISITSPDGDVQIQRSKNSATTDRWLLAPPLAGPAEEAVVDQLIRNARFATWLRQVETAAVDRRAMGFDRPTQVVEFQLAERRYRLRLGDLAPSPAGARYLEVAGEGAPNKGIYVVSGSTAKDFELSPSDFLERQLVPLAGSELSRLVLTHGKVQLAFSRYDAHFRLSTEGDSAGAGSAGDDTGSEGVNAGKAGVDGMRVDRFRMDRLLAAAARLQAKPLVDVERAKRLQQSEDLVRLEFHADERPKDKSRLLPSQVNVTVGGVCPDDPTLRLAVRHQPEPRAGCVPNSDLPVLVGSAAQWVDRRLFQARADEIEEVRIVEGNRTLELARSDDGLIMREPTAGRVEPDVGRQRLSELSELTGTMVTDPVDRASALQQLVASQEKIRLTRTMPAPESTSNEVVRLSPRDGGGWYVQREDDGAVLAVSARATPLFAANALLIKSRQLLDIPAENVLRVTTTYPQQELKQVRRGAYELVRPSGYEVDGALAYDLVAALSQLRVERWVAEASTPAMGLSEAGDRRHSLDLLGGPRPARRVTISHQQGSLDLLVGARAPGGGYFAQLAESPEVFTLRGSLVELLSLWLLDRSLFMIDGSVAQTVRLRSSKGASARFESDGAQLVLRESSPELDSRSAAEVLDALSLLRAEAAVSLEGAKAHHGFAAPLLEVEWTTREPSKPDAARQPSSARVQADSPASPEPTEKTVRWQIGAGDSFRGLSIYYGRVLGDPALYALPRESVQRILAAW